MMAFSWAKLSTVCIMAWLAAFLAPSVKAANEMHLVSSTIAGYEVNYADLMQILVQLREQTDDYQLCARVGESIVRSWGNDAALKFKVDYVPGGTTGCMPTRGLVASWETLLMAYAPEAKFYDGGSATINWDNGVVTTLSFGKYDWQLPRRSDAVPPKFAEEWQDMSFHLTTAQLKEAPYNTTVRIIGSEEAFPGGVAEVENKPRRKREQLERETRRRAVHENENGQSPKPRSVLEGRATIAGCATLSYRHSFSMHTECLCRESNLWYDVECSTQSVGDGSKWSLAMMNSALMSVVSSITANRPNAGEIIWSNPKGAALLNGYNGRQNYNPKGERRDADCCRSAIQRVIQLGQGQGIPAVPASCNCSPKGNANWMVDASAMLYHNSFTV